MKDIDLKSPVYVLLLLAIALPAGALEPYFSGQASSWLTGRQDTAFAAQCGVRYIPTLSMEQQIGTGASLRLELSTDGQVSASRVGDSIDLAADVKPHRLWLRAGSANLESRVGLQQINFGPGAMLRPLMWFDAVDARDPLRMTTGVYGLLLRYYFLNNANAWAWGLIGNDEPRGWEALASKRWHPEFGGRIQLPVAAGEVGASSHFRRAELAWLPPPGVPARTFDLDEHRWGVDGRWSIGIGAWFEAVVGYSRFGDDARTTGVDTLYPSWRRAGVIGVDYTFNVGSGIGVVAEHFRLENATGLLRDPEQRVQLSAVSVGYPLGLLDNLRAIVYYDWEDSKLYNTVTWQRTYNRWAWNVAAFWNPEQTSAHAAGPVASGTAGKGVQLLVFFNH